MHDLPPRDAVVRELAAPVYRALRDAGSSGLSREDLLAAAWLPPETNVGIIVNWIRTHGIDVRYRALPGEQGRFFLVTPLPEAWDQTVR